MELAAVLLTVIALSQQAQQPAKLATVKPKVELQATELDAIGWWFSALASVDANGRANYPDSLRPYLRAVWIPPWGDAEWIGLLDVAVNSAASQTAVLVKGDVHANGWLVVYNLKRLAPDPVQCKRLMSVWDELAVRDPHFHIPELNLEKSKVKAAFLAPHLQDAVARHVTDAKKNQRLDVLVTQITGSTGAIYRADFFLEQIWTSVRGKYPEFIQIDFETKQFTPLQTFLKRSGYFVEQSQDGYGDKAALLIASDIAGGKDRIIDTVYGLFSRQPAVGTFDKKDLRTRASEKFIRNLVEFDPFFDASEWFIPGRNGIPRYVLSDNKGRIQRVAPPDIVADHTKPAGFTHELEMGASCVMCHWPDGGYKLGRNDMELLLYSDSDFLGDDFSHTVNGKRLTREEVVDIVAGRFGEPIYDPDGILGRAERDFARAIAALTSYPVTADGPNAVQRVALKLKEVYHGYRFTTVDADRACLELGVKVEAGQGRDVLKLLCPPPPKGAQEDLLLALLRAGAKISRDDMDALHVDLQRRAIVTRPTLIEEKKNANTRDRHGVGHLAVAG